MRVKVFRACIISIVKEDKLQAAAEGRQPAGAAGVHVAAEVGSRCLLGAGTAAWGRMEGHRLVCGGLGGRTGCWGPVAV